MVLDRSDIESAAHNIAWVEEKAGLLYFRRFTPAQMEVYHEDILFRMMSRCQTGIYLLFQTTGNYIKLVLKKTSVLKILPMVLKELGVPKLVGMGLNTKEQIEQYGDGRLYIDDAFDIFVDGELVSSIKPKSGRIKIKFKNPGHDLKTVKICFPVFAEIGIKKVCGNRELYALKSGKEKMFSFGDSITQGFVAGSPSCSYVARLAEKLDMDALNQGIGGYYFCAHSLNGIEQLPVPKLITVAYGTNDWHIVKDLETFKENTDNYFHKLNNLFPDTPKIVITPIWRGDIETETPIGAFSDIIGVIKESALSIPHTTIVEGLSIVPHEKDCFADGWLHPNAVGFHLMAEGIYNGICLGGKK